MHYPLQHWTLLSPPDTSTTGCGVVISLAQPLHSFWSYCSTLLRKHIGHLPSCGIHLSVSYHFAFSYCSWGSKGKNTELVCHSLLQWTTFLQKLSIMTCASWVALHGLAYSIIELDKSVNHVISFIFFSFL